MANIIDIDFSDGQKIEKQSLTANDASAFSNDLSNMNFNLESQRTSVSSSSGGYQPPVLPDGKEPVKSDQQFANKYQEKAAHLQSEFDLNRAGHPTVCIFTVLFKGLSVTSYLFFALLFNEVTAFIFTVLFAAADFWVVKNISGRLLVGLRWWTSIEADGSEKWHFESHNQNRQTNAIDSRFFWFSQIGLVAFWSLVSIFALFGLKFFWGTACGISLALSGMNLWAYYKCNKEYEKKMEGMAQKASLFAAQKVMSNFL